MLVREEVNAVVERSQVNATLKHFRWLDDITGRREGAGCVGAGDALRDFTLSDGRVSASSRIPEHGEEVTGGAGNHKQMPGEVTVTN